MEMELAACRIVIGHLRRPVVLEFGAQSPSLRTLHFRRALWEQRADLRGDGRAAPCAPHALRSPGSSIGFRSDESPAGHSHRGELRIRPLEAPALPGLYDGDAAQSEAAGRSEHQRLLRGKK